MCAVSRRYYYYFLYDLLLIALKNANGSFILNGDWKIGNARSAEGAGTRFSYVKQDGSSVETISSPGPLANPIDIMVRIFT